MLLQRRSFLLGVGSSLICAPAIVRASSLMPVKLILPDPPKIMKWEVKVRWDEVDQCAYYDEWEEVCQNTMITP